MVRPFGCIKNILAFLGIVFIISMILCTFLVLNIGHNFCGGYIEHISTDYIRKYGGPDHAEGIVKLFSDMVPSDDCFTVTQTEALASICNRHPEIKEKYIEYIVKEILEENKPYFNRLYLILALEVLTEESFEKSGFPMAGWGPDEWAPVEKRLREAQRTGVSPDSEEFREDVERGKAYLRRREMLADLADGVGQVPEEEKPNIQRGLNYIRDWWQKRKEAEHSDTKK